MNLPFFNSRLNTLNFVNNNLPPFDSAKAWFRFHGTTQWIPLALEKISEVIDNEGIIIRANLSDAVANDSVAVDLRISAKDSNGFATDYIVSPAFAVGNWDTVVTDVENPDMQNTVKQFVLKQNYPNPFNPSTTIEYQLPNNGEVNLKIYDILGREVAILVNEIKKSGKYSIEWNASQMASGVYFYRLSSGTNNNVKKLLLLK